MTASTADHTESAAMALLREVRACTHCGDRLPLGARPILQGHPQARLLIVGQAPGRLAHERGRPFDDPSGERLRHWLGLTREQFYNERLIALLPMDFCFPGTGKGGDLPPIPECAARWRGRLLAALPHIETTVLLGRYAIDHHLPGARGRPIGELTRGWRRHLPSLVPLPHPSPRNHRWLAQHPWVEEEIVPWVRERVRAMLSGDGKGA